MRRPTIPAVPAVPAVAMLVAAAAPALADRPGRGWIPAGRVTAMLARRGYRVTRIEADDGHRGGEAMRRGARWEFHVDPRTGTVTKMQRDRH